MKLTIENIKVVKGSRAIMQIENLSLGPQELIAVVGPNGAGKSTFLKVLGGVEKSLGGAARFEEGDLLRLPGEERAKLLGFVPQYFTPHWNQKVYELLELAEEKARVSPDLFGASIEEFALDDLKDRSWDNLSGGERARVLLAMALGGRPPLIIADEPGAAMDVSHNLKMLKTFQKRSKESVILVAIHDLNLAVRFFPRILVMNEGKVVYDGEPEWMVKEKILDEVFNIKFRRVEIPEGFLLFPLDEEMAEY
jgi:iron complex transport system ATP-binding protein